MTELLLRETVAKKIEQKIDRLHKDLDNPTPPIDLENVRELLRIDKQFYTLEDPRLLNRIIHTAILGGKRVLQRPTRIWDAIRKWDLRALWLPDEKSIFINESIPDKKKRWAESHEIGHSILSWHEECLYGDPENSLSLACKEKIEAEANYAAGQILFPSKFFRESLPLECNISLEYIQKTLTKCFGNSITSTLWRTVATLDTPCFGFICENPYTVYSEVKDMPTRHFFRSRTFSQNFSTLTEQMLWDYLSRNCRNTRWKVLDKEVPIRDSNEDLHTFHIETLNLTHYLATFALRIS